MLATISSFQLWGDGHLYDTSSDADRLAAFKSLISTPPYMMGFYKPDWTPPDSPLPPRLQFDSLFSLPSAPEAQSSAVPLKMTNYGSHPSKMPQSTQPGTTRISIPRSLM